MFSVYITFVQIQNKEFSFADSAIRELDIQSLKKETNFFELYINFLKNLITFQLGETDFNESVIVHIKDIIGPTLRLALFTIFGSTFFAVMFFLIYLSSKNGFLKKNLLFLTNLILSTPVFILAIIFSLIFFFKFGILPPGGYGNGNIRYLILPSLSLGLRIFARLFQFSIVLGEEELKSSYIKILQVRGYSKERIIFKHIFLKIVPSIFIFLLLEFGSLLSGAMIVEEIYFYPGIGRSLFYAIKTMDQNLLTVLLFYIGLVFYCLTRFSNRIQRKIIGQNF